MTTLARYLAEYYEHEMNKKLKLPDNERDIVHDTVILQAGIEAYESTEDVKVNIVHLKGGEHNG